MREISQFDSIGQLLLRAVGQDETEVAWLGKHLPSPYMQLYEVWVLPAKGWYFTAEDVKKMHFSVPQQLLNFYDVDLGKSPAPVHVMGKQCDLIETFANNNLVSENACFDYSILHPAVHPVLSIVFGNSRAMSYMYAKGLREKNMPVEVDECSD